MLPSFIKKITTGIITLLLIFIGFFFVLTTVMLGKPELILLVFFLLTGCIFISFSKGKKILYLRDFPLINDSIDILDTLQTRYQTIKPRNIFYYMFYPITSVITFFYSSKTKKELGSYFKIIHWIVLICVVEGLYTNYTLSQDFGVNFALRWTLIELVLIYFLCNFFAIPTLTTSIGLILKEKYKTLSFIIIIMLLCLGSSFYYFSIKKEYSNLILNNIILDTELNNKNAKVNFRKKLYYITRMFLEHHMPKFCSDLKEINRIRNNQEPFEKEQINKNRLLWKKLNEKYQEVLLAICKYGENELFYITTNRKGKNLWGIIFLPIRESTLYAFQYKDNILEIYDNWENIPDNKQFNKRWNQAAYRSDISKKAARVIIGRVRHLSKVFCEQKSIRADYTMKAKNGLAPMKTFHKKVRAPGGTALEKFKFKFELLNEELENLWGYNNFKKKSIHNKLHKLLTEMEDFNFRPITITRNSIPQILNNLTKKWASDCPSRLPLNLSKTIKNVINKHNNMQNLFYKSFEISRTIKIRLNKNKNPNISPKRIKILEKKLEKLKNNINNLTKMQPDYHPVIEKIKSLTYSFREYMDSRFVVYDYNVATFNFMESIKLKLINDHQGTTMDARKENKFTAVFGLILEWLLLVFGAFMPIHVLLITYCNLRTASK